MASKIARKHRRNPPVIFLNCGGVGIVSERETQPQIIELCVITNLMPFERQGETQVPTVFGDLWLSLIHI